MLKHIPPLIRKSARCAFSIIGGLSTLAGLWGYTVKDINENLAWWKCGLIILACFVAAFFILLLILSSIRHQNYQTTINGKRLTIKEGDIFKEKGWKVIPFNEHFDTKVDDMVITHSSLNGKMIDEYVDDIADLEKVIADTSETLALPYTSSGKKCYPLGQLIPYKDFLLLAFSHFDSKNCAYIGIGEYEQLLFRMWTEMRRVYAAKPIVLPLLGGGITTIEGEAEKNYTEFLKCIICTLRSSKFQPVAGITIVLTKDIMEKIDMNTIREEY